MLVASQLRQISVYLGHDIKSSILLSAVVAVLVFPLAAMRNLDRCVLLQSRICVCILGCYK